MPSTPPAEPLGGAGSVAVLEEVGETLPAGVVAPGLVEERVVSPPPPAKPPAKPATKPATKADKPAKAVAKASPPPPARPAATPAADRKPAKKRATRPIPASVWVEPTGATCPPSHPVKVKLASRLFQLPGMFAYERTRPDRCYADEAAAAAEGFTRAKR